MDDHKYEDSSKTQAEEEELEKLLATKKLPVFGAFTRKKEADEQRSTEATVFLVEEAIAMLEVAAEEDALLNTQGKPCVFKLRKLPFLLEALSKKQLQKQFLGHGILTTLKNWLEPLPDGSLPNAHIREAILWSLTNQFKVDTNQVLGREQLKKSGLGKVIMFLSMTNEETESNRKLAKDLVNEWSRGFYNKSTSYQDLRDELGECDEANCTHRISTFKTRVNSSQPTSRTDALRPERTTTDFVIRPKSKIDPVAIRKHENQMKQEQRCARIIKKMKEGKIVKKKSR